MDTRPGTSRRGWRRCGSGRSTGDEGSEPPSSADARRRPGGLAVRRLHLYTEAAAGFYARLGWSVVTQEECEGESVVVMVRASSVRPPFLSET
jgi:hypothetical protein